MVAIVDSGRFVSKYVKYYEKYCLMTDVDIFSCVTINYNAVLQFILYMGINIVLVMILTMIVVSAEK